LGITRLRTIAQNVGLRLSLNHHGLWIRRWNQFLRKDIRVLVERLNQDFDSLFQKVPKFTLPKSMAEPGDHFEDSG
jgi:hypothetical protein